MTFGSQIKIVHNGRRFLKKIAKVSVGLSDKYYVGMNFKQAIQEGGADYAY